LTGSVAIGSGTVWIANTERTAADDRLDAMFTAAGGLGRLVAVAEVVELLGAGPPSFSVAGDADCVIDSP
jgi:hypothetical protein